MNTRKPHKQPLGDTAYLLEQWGWWRLDGRGIPRGVSATQALMRGKLPVPMKSYCITDELAEVVDGAVARLCRRHQQMGDVLWYYYAAKWPALRIGHAYHVSETKARELVSAGVAWVDCELEKVREMT